MNPDHREKLDAALLRSLGERRALREHRAHPSTVWDRLEAALFGAATLLWELPAAAVDEPLLTFCVDVARELAAVEALDLDTTAEWERLCAFAPGAIAELDARSEQLASPAADALPVPRALAAAFGALRAELACACPFAWSTAA